MKWLESWCTSRASSIKKAIEEAFVQLGYLKPTSSQEYAITEFVLARTRRVCVLRESLSATLRKAWYSIACETA